jgi:polyribonucleotide nucleotidyltransferase
MIIKQVEIHGKTITIETGVMARLAGGSVVVRCLGTVVIVTACTAKGKAVDFLPLTMEYVEKTYAAGKIPGSYFKREGKLSERETLVSRLMDRPCRPLFPEWYREEVQVIATVVSADENADPDVLAVCGASAAISLCDAPFEGPVGAVRVVRVNGQLKLNPNKQEMLKADLNFVVAGTKDAITMVEGGADQVPEAEVLEALLFAHKEMQPLVQIQEALAKECGRAKVVAPELETTESEFSKKARAFMAPKIELAVRVKEKEARREALSKVKSESAAELLKADSESAATDAKTLALVFEDVQYNAVRQMAFKEKSRIDGRDFYTVRPITVELGLLPMTHGSALFTRGETQALVVSTLGMSDEAQRFDSLIGEESKRFMLHYNFPSFSVGEVKPMRGPGRREIGHGALAERAVKAVMPDESKFPYVVRIVSEILESNGSSSMASVCGASLALMDAGVPIKAAVAGVAMGLMKEGNDVAILTDILGDEDHLGDMDFKVCGTEQGITALQMDIKIKGLDADLLDKALNQAKDARMHILGELNKAILKPRNEFKSTAPRIVTIKINPEKIRDVIGPGGKMIRSITESCGVKMEVNDAGIVSISANDDAKIRQAVSVIESLTMEAEVGKIYKGIVKRIADFGAFVEILPGTDGLVHVSQLADHRVNRVEDVVREGDEVHVKVLEVDRQGKIRLSLKDAIADMAAQI